MTTVNIGAETTLHLYFRILRPMKINKIFVLGNFLKVFIMCVTFCISLYDFLLKFRTDFKIVSSVEMDLKPNLGKCKKRYKNT